MHIGPCRTLPAVLPMHESDADGDALGTRGRLAMQDTSTTEHRLLVMLCMRPHYCVYCCSCSSNSALDSHAGLYNFDANDLRGSERAVGWQTGIDGR